MPLPSRTTSPAKSILPLLVFVKPPRVHVDPDVVARPQALPGPYGFGIGLTFWAMAVGWAAFGASMLGAGVYPRLSGQVSTPSSTSSEEPGARYM